jgi:hypothetical protein
MKMKKLIIALGLGVFLLGLTACSEAQPYEAYVTVDINPSIGFVVNEQNVVKTAYALNEDGEMLMLQLNLAEKSVEAALGEVIDEAIDLGFIDVDATETTIEVDALGETEQITKRVREMVQEKVSDHMSERALNANVRSRVYDTTEQAAAQNKGVSPMQIRLLNQAMLMDPELSEDEALEATPEGLITRMRASNQVAAVAQELKDEFQAAKDLIHEEYDSQIEALVTAIAEATEAGTDTTALEAELDALKDAMHDEIVLVVDTYISQSEPLMAAIQTQYQARIQTNAEKVNEYRQGLDQNQDKTSTSAKTTS